MSSRRANATMVYSVLAGREVDTWSEEWKHECEIAFLASMPLGKRNETLDGVTGSQDRDARGIKGIRGEAALRGSGTRSIGMWR